MCEQNYGLSVMGDNMNMDIVFNPISANILMAIAGIESVDKAIRDDSKMERLMLTALSIVGFKMDHIPYIVWRDGQVYTVFVRNTLTDEVVHSDRCFDEYGISNRCSCIDVSFQIFNYEIGHFFVLRIAKDAKYWQTTRGIYKEDIIDIGTTKNTCRPFLFSSTNRYFMLERIKCGSRYIYRARFNFDYI